MQVLPRKLTPVEARQAGAKLAKAGCGQAAHRDGGQHEQGR